MANTYTVKRGDTLSEIAQRYLGSASKYKYLAKINNIPNPNRIYVGQVIKLSAGGSSSSRPSGGGSSGGGSYNPSYRPSSPSGPSMVTINQFGLQSDTDRTIFVTWDWSRSNTENYKIRWWYKTKDNVALLGTETTSDFKQSTYNAPQNAEVVWVNIQPISKKYTRNDKEYSYWTAQWSSARHYYFKDAPPTKPPAPTVKIEKYKLTAELANININAKEIQFQVVKNDTSIFNTGNATINTSAASYSCTVDAGFNYKVRCRGVRDGRYSDWSDYSSNTITSPSTPEKIISCKAASKTSVFLEWTAVDNAQTYDIEYTTKKTNFDLTTDTTKQTGIEFTKVEKTGLEPGKEYFFRVRAVNSAGASPWSEIKSVVLGKNPAAPTTWSSTTTAIVGESLKLYWVHNSADGSSQTFAELEIYIGGVKESHIIENTRTEEEKDKTSVYTIDTSKYDEGVKIQWRVRTAGITKALGEWSVQRTVDIYAPPTLTMNITDANKRDITVLTEFPFYISALAGPKTQVPIGYQLVITSKNYYTSTDEIGNNKIVNVGDEVFSRYFDISEALLVELSANNIDLENNAEYTVTCIVTMNSGLTAKASADFKVSWVDDLYLPNASITIDKDTLVAYIQPYCDYYPMAYYRVNLVNGVYTATNEEIPELEGISIDELSDTEEIVYKHTASTGEITYFRMALSKTPKLVPDVMLSVYRREFDGGFTEIAKNIANNQMTHVTDPHPALDFARYRIVATTISTGAVSYYDVPGHPTGETAIIIQWNEEWTKFNTTAEEALEKPPWSGSLLKLPYNIDVSDKNGIDVKFVEYQGRKHPVSYYGTQVGETASWKVDIDANDKDTIYALRRLKIWMGDVYVREPSGTGFWASISVSFSQNHLEVTVPVTLELTRVEGGM